jgi:glucosamine-6-phosphate deaminase
MLQHDLLALLPEPPGVIHRLDAGVPDADAECARFDGLIEAEGLSLTLLGLGGNGHLGLNEPGTEIDSPTRAVDLTPATTNSASRYDAEARPIRGMTLGIQRIMESDEIWLLVTGGHKAAVLERMLTGPVGAGLPASYLRDHPNAIVLADEAAAAGI